MTPLHYSAANGSTRVAEILVESGASLSVSDKFGNEPLWTAVFNARGNYEIGSLFVRNGANPKHENKAGRSPVDFARQIRDPGLIDIIGGWSLTLVKKLSEILESIEEYEIDFVIYLPKSEKWGLDTKAAILDPDEAEDPDGDAHDFVNAHGLSYISEVSVVDQIRQTGDEPDVGKLFSGFVHYFENDAFKRWEDG